MTLRDLLLSYHGRMVIVSDETGNDYYITCYGREGFYADEGRYQSLERIRNVEKFVNFLQNHDDIKIVEMYIAEEGEYGEIVVHYDIEDSHHE